MSPRILKDGELIFWFHSYDDQHESRASVHVGIGSQNDTTDAKIWLEPEIAIARTGRTLSRTQLNRALTVIERDLNHMREAWNAHKRKTE